LHAMLSLSTLLDYEIALLLISYIKRNQNKYHQRILYYQFPQDVRSSEFEHPYYAYLYMNWWHTHKFGYKDLDNTPNKLVEYITILECIYAEEEKSEMAKIRQSNKVGNAKR